MRVVKKLNTSGLSPSPSLLFSSDPVFNPCLNKTPLVRGVFYSRVSNGIRTRAEGSTNPSANHYTIDTIQTVKARLIVAKNPPKSNSGRSAENRTRTSCSQSTYTTTILRSDMISGTAHTADMPHPEIPAWLTKPHLPGGTTSSL